MKVKYSIFITLLTIFCTALLSFHSDSSFCMIQQNFKTAVAKEATANKHNTLSNAFLLSAGQTCKKTLPAYDTFYAYVTSPKGLMIQLQSNAIHTLKITLLSDTGKTISHHSKLSDNTSLITFSDNQLLHSQGVFLKIYNASSKDIFFQIKLQRKNTIQPTSKPKVYSTTKKKLSTKKEEKAVLNPQFILMKPHSKHKLSLKTQNKHCNFSNYIMVNTDSGVAVIKKETVYAIKEGITIIFFQKKNNPAITYSCFIRVLDT